MSKRTRYALQIGDSKGNQEVCTPPWLLDVLRQNYGAFDHDPCPYPKPPEFDGLAPEHTWGRQNFVNPPYNNIPKWIDKAIEQRDKNGAMSLFLIPHRPHSAYWRQKIVPQALSIRIILEKIAFQGYDRPCPFPLALVEFGPGYVPQRVQRFEGPDGYLECMGL